MRKLTLGTLLAAIVLFIWMAISWMVLPWHCATLGKFTHEESVASVIMSNTTTSGIYILPHCVDQKNELAANEAAKRGPIVFSAIQRNGRDFSSPKPYIVSFIIQLIGAFFVTFMTLQARFQTYSRRLLFVTAFGIAAGILAAFPEWNWWGFSFSYALVGFLDFVIGWFLAGLVIAAIAKRQELV